MEVERPSVVRYAVAAEILISRNTKTGNPLELKVQLASQETERMRKDCM